MDELLLLSATGWFMIAFLAGLGFIALMAVELWRMGFVVYSASYMITAGLAIMSTGIIIN